MAETVNESAGYALADFHVEFGGIPKSPTNEFLTAAAIAAAPGAVQSTANITRDVIAYLREYPLSITINDVRSSTTEADVKLTIRNNRGHGCVIRGISVGDMPGAFKTSGMTIGHQLPGPKMQEQPAPIRIYPEGTEDVTVTAVSPLQSQTTTIEVFFQFFDREPPEGRVKRMGKAVGRLVGLSGGSVEERFESVTQSLFIPPV